MFYKTDHTQIKNSDSKYNLEIFKNQKSNSKRPPKLSKNQKQYKEASNPQVW